MRVAEVSEAASLREVTGLAQSRGDTIGPALTVADRMLTRRTELAVVSAAQVVASVARKICEMVAMMIKSSAYDTKLSY